MTKSQESGENEITREALAEATRTGADVCAVLAAMLTEATVVGDQQRIRKIIKAQKYLGCRNIRKRRKHS